MKRIVLSVALCVCGIFTVNAQQDLKKSVCVVKQNHTEAETSAYEKTASTLFSNSYMSAARQLRKGSVSFGSGFLYKADNGKLYIITNKHVVKDAKTVQLIFKTDGADKTIPNCNVVAKSDSTDIAIVEFPSADNDFIPLSFSTEPLSDGTNVWSAGFPGLGDEPAWQLGNGVISNGKYRNLEITDGAHIDIIQHTAQVDPGSSGGPLLVLNENKKTITKEETVGKNKKTVTETVVEKEYKVVGMNTWKAFRRENANFSLMTKDVQKVVNNIGMASSSKSDANDALQKQVEKFMESFNKTSSDMTPFVSNKMATSIPESQLLSMLQNISTNANNKLRDGDAVDGLKMMIADNIKAPVKKPAELKVSSVNVNGNSGTANFTYGKKQYSTTWTKNYEGWQLESTDMIGAKAAKERGTVEDGFRVLDFDGFNRVELSYMAPLGDPKTFVDEDWNSSATYTDKFKIGFDYSHFFSRFVNWTTAFDFGKLDKYTTNEYSEYDSEYHTYMPVIEENSTMLKYFSLVTGVGAQCPMAVNRIYFAPDVRAQFGMRLGIGDFLEDSDNGMGFITALEATLNAGYMFDDEKILYLGFGVHRKKILGDLAENHLDCLRYFVVKVGYLFNR